MSLFDSNAIVAILQDGRVIAYSKRAVGVIEDNTAINIRVPDLKMIEYVLQVQFITDPNIVCTAVDKSIAGNVVGMTLATPDVGTTLTVEVIAIGPP